MFNKLILFIINKLKYIYFVICIIIFILCQKIIFVKKLLHMYNIYGEIEGLEKYYDFKKNNTRGLAVFNHVSMLDGLILLNEFKCPITFLVNKNFFTNLFKNFIEKHNGIMVDTNKKQNNTQKIIELVNNRKKNDPVLFIAPSGGGEAMNQKDKFKLSEFKTGAFVTLSPILPIIIKFNPYYIDPKTTEETVSHIIENTNNLSYKVKILDPIYPQENDTIESFRDRVYEKMNIEKNKLKVNKKEEKKEHIFLFILINLLLLLSLLYSQNIYYLPIILITIIPCIILYLKKTHYIYNFLYSNIIYFNTLIILIYSLKNRNPMLFIQIILCIILYKLCQK